MSKREFGSDIGDSPREIATSQSHDEMFHPEKLRLTRGFGNMSTPQQAYQPHKVFDRVGFEDYLQRVDKMIADFKAGMKK